MIDTTREGESPPATLCPGITPILGDILAEILAEMRGEGMSEPLPWDVNNGWCEEFGVRAEGRIPGAYGEWDDEDNGGVGHYIVFYEGRAYDAEALDGRDDPRHLPIYGDNPRPSPPATTCPGSGEYVPWGWQRYTCPGCHAMVWRDADTLGLVDHEPGEIGEQPPEASG